MSTSITEAEILAFFEQDSSSPAGLTDEEFAELCALATPESFESQLDVDAFFAELGFPTMQTQSTSEIEPMPTFAPDFDPLAPANMTPPEFVAFCGYDPSEFKSLGASCLNSLVDGVEIWSRVFEEITEKMQQSTAVGDTLFTDMDMGGNALQPIVSH